jgi:predicted Rossmann fold nucleotide-binding protein DprA/Smf involved in DNA uptake
MGILNMSQYPETVYWLTLIQESGLKLNRIKPIIQRWCLIEQRPMAELFGLTPLDWSTTFGLDEQEAKHLPALVHKLDTHHRAITAWQSQGIETLIRTDPRYPKRLGYPLPPVQQPLMLWAQGNLELLTAPGLTILGQDSPTDPAFLNELLDSLVENKINLIGGYNRGLDRDSATAMLSAGGQAVAVLPMGLSAFADVTAKLNHPLESGQIVLVSPFSPETPYQNRLADARNLLIDHMALVLLTLEPSEEILQRAAAALSRDVPVLMARPQTITDSHKALLNEGAILLTDTGEVIEMAQQAIFDATLDESDDEEIPVVQIPPAPAMVSTESTEDYALSMNDIGPIDPDEAEEILSMGGEIPQILQQRLHNLKKNQPKE